MKQTCFILPAGIFLAGLMIMAAPIMAASYNPQTCPAALRKTAIRESYEMNSWPDLHLKYQQFKGCDAGAVATSFGYNIVQLMTEHWDQTKSLAPLLKADPDFQTFIIGHITYATTPLQRRAILDDIRGTCPQGTQALCQGIKDQLDGIIVETHRYKTE